MGKFPVIPSEAARRAAQPRDLIMAMAAEEKNRTPHYAPLRSAPVGMTSVCNHLR